MREKNSNGMQELEHRLSQKIDEKLFHLQHALEREKETRQQLEERVAKLEQAHISTWNMPKSADIEDIDKSVVVIRSFIDHAVAEVETLVKEMMLGVTGFKEVEVVENTSRLALATFESPMQVSKFIRSQGKHQTNGSVKQEKVGEQKQHQNQTGKRLKNSRFVNSPSFHPTCNEKHAACRRIINIDRFYLCYFFLGGGGFDVPA